jgi:hypothetical protein
MVLELRCEEPTPAGLACVRFPLYGLGLRGGLICGSVVLGFDCSRPRFILCGWDPKFGLTVTD